MLFFHTVTLTRLNVSETTKFSFCLQVQLYEDFAKSRAKASVEDSISTEEEEKPKLKATGHVFQVGSLNAIETCCVDQLHI